MASPLLKDIFIVAAKRTPFGAFGGTLKAMTPTELGVVASKAAIAECGIDASKIDSTCFGNVAQTTADGPYLARHVALKAGCANEQPALTVNRLCGSGFQSIITGCQEIQLGEAEVVLTGGAESMSQAPYALRNVRWGTGLGTDLKATDTLWECLTDQHIGTPMAITAENLAEQFDLSKDDCDAYALSSQQRYEAAKNDGRFDAEIAPVTIKHRKKGEIEFATDEHTRPGSTIEGVSKLPAIFKKGGTVSAGNASGICDGAGAVIIASADACAEHGLAPLAKVRSYHVSGVDPTIMGFGPVPAIRGALEKAGLALEDMDLIEINEAFAAQYLACEKELGLDRAISNSNGGAIAMGHPTGASGSRIMAHLTHELKRTGGKYAVGSACIGGGQGVAIVLESC
jgi:acetyl-CoA acyltransferase 2